MLEDNTDVVPVLAGKRTNLMDHVILRIWDMAECLDEDFVAARLFADLDDLAGARQTRDFPGSKSLVHAPQTLGADVLGILVQVPEIPISGAEADLDEA